MTAFTNGYFYDCKSRTFILTSLLCNNSGKIVSFPFDMEKLPRDAEVVDLQKKYIIPGLVDAHTHGRSGFDFNSIPEENMPEILLDYAKSGTTALCPTLASDSYELMISSAIMIRKFYMLEDAGATVAGLHIEGRYLSEARRGAHASKYLAEPSVQEFKDFQCAFYEAPLHFTIAPELYTAETFIRYAVEEGATVGIGHTNDSFEHANEAISWGATSFTHTFNAMSPVHHRQPGVAGASLLNDSVYSEFICDGFHVHESIIQLAYRVKPHDRFVLVSDSMEATGMPDGKYSIAGMNANVIQGIAITSEGKLAGSTLTLFKAMQNIKNFCHLSLEEVVPLATINPARMLGIDSRFGSFEEEKICHFIVLTDKDNPEIDAVYTNGKRITD